MGKLNLSSIVLSVRNVLKKHSPEILTGMGIAGMVMTVVMAVKATPKAISLLEAKKFRHDFDDGSVDTKLTPMDVVKTTWKCYIPATITGGLSIGCLIAAGSVNMRRQAALATAYTLSESALREYQAKVVETFGEKKEQEVRNAIANDRVTRTPSGDKEIIITEKGNTLCFDTISGRYFKSDVDKIKRIENEMNRRMITDMYVSLNDFYYELGLNPTKIGSDIGWNIDKGFMKLDFSSQLADDGTPCLVIDYSVVPLHNFDR